MRRRSGRRAYSPWSMSQFILEQVVRISPRAASITKPSLVSFPDSSRGRLTCFARISARNTGASLPVLHKPLLQAPYDSLSIPETTLCPQRIRPGPPSTIYFLRNVKLRIGGNGRDMVTSGRVIARNEFLVRAVLMLEAGERSMLGHMRGGRTDAAWKKTRVRKMCFQG